MSKRKPIDWESIAAAYRADVLSVREIAAQHKVSHTIINRQAKKRGWQRDLSARVQQQVSTKLVSDVSVYPGNTEQIIDQASDQVVQVVKLHRKSVRSLREIAADLLLELEKNEEQQIVSKDGKIVSVKMSLKDRSDILRSLTNAASKYITLERQAWGLTEKPGEQQGNHEAALDDLE